MREKRAPQPRLRPHTLLIALLGLATAALLTVGALGAREAEPGDLAFEFNFTSGAGNGTAYTCDALVRDAASGNVLAAPRLVAKSGEEAYAESTLASGESVQLKMTLDADGKRATAAAIVLRAGKVLRSQTITLTITG